MKEIAYGPDPAKHLGKHAIESSHILACPYALIALA